MNLERARQLLTPAQREDCAQRYSGEDLQIPMGGSCMFDSVSGIKQYLWEIKEVEKATKRMEAIDLAISELSPEDQQKRRNRIEAQRKAFNATVYAIANEPLT